MRRRCTGMLGMSSPRMMLPRRLICLTLTCAALEADRAHTRTAADSRYWPGFPTGSGSHWPGRGV